VQRCLVSAAAGTGSSNRASISGVLGDVVRSHRVGYNDPSVGWKSMIPPIARREIRESGLSASL
jgi:hypothetical protein